MIVLFLESSVISWPTPKPTTVSKKEDLSILLTYQTDLYSMQYDWIIIKNIIWVNYRRNHLVMHSY